jgi:beta-glucanase (GH16 family)
MKFKIEGLTLLVMMVATSYALAEEAPSRPGWDLVWHDEFDGPTLDLTKWNYRQLGPRESALIAKDSVSLDGQGHLLLTVKEVDGKMHNGMIGTQGKFSGTYGLYEARIQFPRMQGQHGSFWMQPDKPKDRAAVNNPAVSGAEIDVIEFFGVGRKDGGTASNIYWPGPGDAKKNHAGGTKDFHSLLPKKGDEWSDDYHIYAVEWSPQEYVFSIDGKETYRIREGVSQTPQYMILSLLTADWEAARLDKAKLPDAMKVDWVRVWKKKAA